MHINQTFEWFRCTNGYEIFDSGGVDEGPWIDLRPLSDNTEKIFPFVEKGPDVLLQFASIRTDEDVLFFVDEFGPLEAPGRTAINTENSVLNFKYQVDMISTVLREYAETVSLPEGKQRDEILDRLKNHFNPIWEWAVTTDSPEMVFLDGKPVLRHTPSDLKSALWLELIELMQLQIIYLQCAEGSCRKWFRPKRRKKINAEHSFCCKDHRTQFSNRKQRELKRKEAQYGDEYAREL